MVRSRSDEQFRRTRDLTTRLLETGLDDAESRELADLLRDDDELQAWYVDHVVLHGMLELTHLKPLQGEQQEPPGEGVCGGQCGGVDVPLPEDHGKLLGGSHGSDLLRFLGDFFRHGASWLGSPGVFSLFLAIGLPGLVGAVLVVGLLSLDTGEEVATITRMHQCVGRLDDGRTPLCTGMSLVEGQHFTVEQGLLEIEFGDGAKAVLEAPAEFAVGSANAGFLRVGRLTARVPQGARGFVIDTPLARVIDLGTDFGVCVANDGEAETHVFEGEVKVGARAAPDEPVTTTKRLEQGEAARVPPTAAGQPVRIVAMAAVPKQFVRSITPPAPTRFAHEGSKDPVTEGWDRCVLFKGKRLDPDYDPAMTTPINDASTAAWKMSNGRPAEVRYNISRDNGLTKEIADRAREKGWVLRARIKVVKVPKTRSVCFVMYHGETHTWALFPEMMPDGTQRVIVEGQSEGVEDRIYRIPNSRGRYVDYEIRYRPETQDAEVFVDGKSIATGFSRPKMMRGVTGVMFGLQQRTSEARFAKVEWEILDDKASAEQSRGN